MLESTSAFALYQVWVVLCYPMKVGIGVGIGFEATSAWSMHVGTHMYSGKGPP